MLSKLSKRPPKLKTRGPPPSLAVADHPPIIFGSPLLGSSHMNLDRYWITRLQRLSNRKNIGAKQVFMSDRVIRDFPKEKISIQGSDSQELLSVIPFHGNVYCTVCPGCASRTNSIPLLKLARAGLVVPVLLSWYEYYDDRFAQEIRGVDHISAHEFNFFSELRRKSEGEPNICPTCAWEDKSKTLDLLKNRRGARLTNPLILDEPESAGESMASA